MGSHREAPPLLIQPRFSRRLALFVTLTHGASAAAVLTLPLGWTTGALLAAIALGAVYVVFVDVLRRAPWSIHSALWSGDGSWRIRFVSGRECDARLSPATFVSLPLVVLSFRVGRLGRRALPLFADALDREPMRRLRGRLRLEGSGVSLTSASGDSAPRP